MADFLSFEFTKVAWDAPVKTAAQRLILLCLGRHSDADGRAFPSADLIAEETRLNRKTVFSALKDLQSMGIISCEKRINRPNANLYRLLANSTETGTTKNGSTEIGSTEIGTTGSTKNGTSIVPKSVLEHNSNKTCNKNKEVVARFARPARFVPEEVQTGEVSEQAFADYQTVRKAKRAGPVTPTSWSRLKREAAKASLSLQAAVELCAERGWTSVNSNWESLGGKGKNRKTTPEHDLLHATAEDFKNKNWYEGATRLPDGTYRI